MKVLWQKGGEAEIVAIAIDKVSLLSTIPSPPGSRIDGALAMDPLEGTTEVPRLRVKVHGCKKEPDGRFRIEGRPLDLTRALLERL